MKATRKWLADKQEEFVLDRDDAIVEKLEEFIELMNPEFGTVCLAGTKLKVV